MHVPTSSFEVARSEAQLGHLVEASDMLARVERMPERPDDPQAFKDARDYARRLDAEIQPRIPKVRLRVEGTDAGAVTVTVDGESVPTAALDVPYAIDPGPHAFAVQAGDGRTATQEVLVSEGDQREVVLALVGEAPAPASLPPPLPEVPVVTPAPQAGGRRAFAWVAFSTAAVAAGAGGATGIVAWTRKSSISSQCNGSQCPPSTYADLDGARTLATVSTVSFIVAGAAAVAGVVTLLTGPGPQASVPAAAGGRIDPWIGIGSAGITGAF
jgi:hypothetical protein